MKKSAETRLDILQKAFELIYMHGYQATSVDQIIAETKVTKGAFYYHFKNKEEMGLAVINEIMKPGTHDSYVKPLMNSKDPVKEIYAMMKELLMDNKFLKVEYGCPAGNLTAEMSAFNDEFNAALSELINEWESALKISISNGKKAGTIRAEVNAQQVAYFVMSGYWGIRNYGKLQHGKEPYLLYLKELKNYLKGLQ